MIRPDINAPINGGGSPLRQWIDFFFSIYNAVGLAKTTKTVAATIDFASVGAGLTVTNTVTVAGARANDEVKLGLPATLDAGLCWDAHVSADDTVTIRATNITAGAIDPASATYRVTVTSY